MAIRTSPNANGPEDSEHEMRMVMRKNKNKRRSQQELNSQVAPYWSFSSQGMHTQVAYSYKKRTMKVTLIRLHQES